MGKNSPCYTCVKRALLCHAQCSEYHEWVERMRAEKDAIKSNDADAHASAVMYRNCKRAKVKRQRGQR